MYPSVVKMTNETITNDFNSSHRNRLLDKVGVIILAQVSHTTGPKAPPSPNTKASPQTSVVSFVRTVYLCYLDPF